MLNPYESPAAASDQPPAHQRASRLVLAWFVGTLAAAVIGVTTAAFYQLIWVSLIAAVVLPLLALVLAGIRQTAFLVRIAVYATIGWGLCYLFQPAESSRRPRPTPPSVYFACHGIAFLLTGVGVAFEYDQQRAKQERGAPVNQ